MRSLYCPLHEARICGYHLSPKIVSSVRGFRWKIPISMSLGVSSLPSLAAFTSAFRALWTKLSAARWLSCAPLCSLAVRSRRANSLIAPGSRVPASPISYALSKPRAGSSASASRARVASLTVTAASRVASRGLGPYVEEECLTQVYIS